MALAELPPDLFRRKPATKEWSAFDCLQHLLDTERGVFPPRIGHLLRGEDFPAFDPDSQGTVQRGDLKPGELAREFGRLRWGSLSLLSRLSPGDLVRKARHAELGPVTMNELIHEWAGHDLMHTVQGEHAILQPFIEGCGPWKPYFADHVTAKKP
jgi:hypothetical protein